MDRNEKKRCAPGKATYPHGAEITERGRILECFDDRWEELTFVSGI